MLIAYLCYTSISTDYKYHLDENMIYLLAGLTGYFADPVRWLVIVICSKCIKKLKYSLIIAFLLLFLLDTICIISYYREFGRLGSLIGVIGIPISLGCVYFSHGSNKKRKGIINKMK